MSSLTIHTVGHSTRPIDDFVPLLHAGGIRRLVDVRRYPASRRHPQFGKVALRAHLEHADVAYRHEPAMGGRRIPEADSPNTAWRNRGFRGYADHLASAVFQEALERLEEEAALGPTVIMCAEAVPWRCHRRLIADALVARGHEVLHLIQPGRSERHALAEHARIGPDGVLRYPTPGDAQGELL